MIENMLVMNDEYLYIKNHYRYIMVHSADSDNEIPVEIGYTDVFMGESITIYLDQASSEALVSFLTKPKASE